MSTATKAPKTVLTTWDLRTFDVWGNAKDGYEVNDSFAAGRVEIRCKVQTYNAGMPGEFTGAFPSDYQLKRAIGANCAIDVDSDDTTIYVNRKSDSYPLCELHCTSHESLSPIRANTSKD